MTRNQMVASALGLVVGAGAIGWVAGAQIMSPAEAAANARPPEASLITVAVEERVLSADIIARGSIDYDDPIALSLSGSTGDPEAKQIITAIPAEGTELGEGSVCLEVAGRPVFLLQGVLLPHLGCGPAGVPGPQGPHPHGRQTSVFLEPRRIGPGEDHGEGLLANGGPDMLEVFLERDGLAAGLLHPRVA